MLVSGLYTHSFSYTRIVGSGQGIKVITEVTQTLMCSLSMTVKTGHKAAHPLLLSQYNDHTVSGRQQDPDHLTSEDKDERGHPGHEDYQPGASRPTPGNHHPCTRNSHNTCTKLKGKLPKEIEFLGISPAPAPSHQS